MFIVRQQIQKIRIEIGASRQMKYLIQDKLLVRLVKKCRQPINITIRHQGSVITVLFLYCMYAQRFTEVYMLVCISVCVFPLSIIL